MASCLTPKGKTLVQIRDSHAKMSFIVEQMNKFIHGSSFVTDYESLRKVSLVFQQIDTKLNEASMLLMSANSVVDQVLSSQSSQENIHCDGAQIDVLNVCKIRKLKTYFEKDMPKAMQFVDNSEKAEQINDIYMSAHKHLVTWIEKNDFDSSTCIDEKTEKNKQNIIKVVGQLILKSLDHIEKNLFKIQNVEAKSDLDARLDYIITFTETVLNYTLWKY